MSWTILFLATFIASFISGTLSVIVWERRHLYECKGSIIMYEDQVYLSLTKEDMEAFQTAHYATLKLQREKFKGFNET